MTNFAAAAWRWKP